MKTRLFAIITLLLLLTANVTLAATSWKGTSSTAWATAANWTAGVPTATVDAIIGDTNFTGAFQPGITAAATCKSLTLGTGTKASTLTVNQTFTVSGNITIGTNGAISQTVSSNTRVIGLTGNWTNSGSYVGTGTRSGVTFSGTNQIIGGTVATGFRKLTINNGSTTTLAGNISVTNTLTVTGTLDPGAGSGFVVTGAGTTTVSATGKLLIRAATFGGNYALTGSKTLSAGSTVDYTATGNQTVTNLTYSTLRISGSGVKSLAANLTSLSSSSSANGNIDIASGTLDLVTFTANRGTTTNGGTFTVEGGATLRIGGTGTFPANYATHSLALSSTVEYYGTNQVVATNAYGNLALGSSGTASKTMATNALVVAGNLTTATNAPGAAVTFTANSTITVNGSVSIGGGTTFNGSNFTHAVSGNWTNNGTFSGSNSTVTLNGSGAILTGAGTNNFFNLTLNAAGITADANTSLVVAGNFATTGAGAFTHTPGGTGTATMSGAGKSISGTGIAFSKLVVSGTNSTSASFTVADNLTVNGSLTASGGSVTLSGTGKTIAGNGAIAFSGLSIPGSITTTNNFSLAGNLAASGSFTATAGTVTFNGSTLFSGTANLFNATLNGTLLRLSSASTLGLAGTTTLTAGTFDVTNLVPNTVVYNGAGSQTAYPLTYYNLEIGGGGVKSAIGNLTALGNFTIDSGATFNGGAGNYTNYVAGNWQNNGTFTAGNSTVELTGAANATVNGTTVFNQLRLNKANSTLVVNLGTNETVGTLDMALGSINTGTNTLTLTTTRTNSGIVLGTITHQHSFTTNVSYAFESPYNTISFAAETNLSSVTVTVAVGNVADFPGGGAINRQYTVSLGTTNAYNATLQAHYEDGELNGNGESLLALDQNTGGTWLLSGRTSGDTNNNWVANSGLTNLTGRWTLDEMVGGTVAWNGSVSTAWEAPANWTVISGVPAIPPSTIDIVQLGTMAATYQPTISATAAVKSIAFGSSQAMTLTLSGGSLQTIANISGTWNSNVTHSIAVGAQTLTVGGSLSLSDGTNGHVINLNIGSGTVNMVGDLSESGGASITFSGAGNLNLTNNFNYTSGTFTPGSGTVNYTGGGAQTVAPVSYNQLTFNKAAGVATLTGNAAVNGNLTLTNGGTFYFAGNVTVAGSVYIRAGTVLNPAASTTLSVGGDWDCGGTFSPAGGLVAFNGAGAQAIGATAFYDLDINKPAGTATLAGNISSFVDVEVRSGTLDMGGFTVTASGSGSTLTVAAGAALRTAGSFPGGFVANMDPASTVEYYGSGSQTVLATSYGNLLLNNGGSNPKTLAGSSTIAGNLTVNSGVLTNTTGTVTLSGAGKTISGSGAIAFNNLSIPGSLTTANSFSLAGNLAVGGSFTATAGTVTFNGSTVFSGTANLYNATLNGTLLRMSSAATLGLAGTITLTAGTFDVTNQVPNTIVYNGAGSQTTYPITYYHLEIAGGGTKSSTGNLSALGNFTIDNGATFSGGSGGYTNYVAGNWLNNGTFTAGNSTVEMNGAANATIAGLTAFNQLRVNKSGSTLVVNLTTNETVGTLDMTLGTINTGTNALTLTTTRTNSGIVLGTIIRQHSFATNVSYAFEGPYNTINFASASNVSSVTVTVAIGNVGDFPGGGAINRQYTVSLITTNPYSATWQAHYEDGELNGNAESLLALDQNTGGTWLLSGRTGGDTNNNWVANGAITNLTGRWTLSSTVGGTVAWNGSVSTAWENPTNWTVVAGVPAKPPSVNDITQLGTTTATFQPTIAAAAAVKSISLGSAQAMTLTLGAGGSLQTVANISATWSSNVTHTIAVGAQTLTVGGSMALSDGTTGHKINLTIGSGTVNIGGDLTESGGAAITCSGAGKLNLSANFNYTSGTFTPGSGTVTYTGGAAQTVAPVTYNQLLFNKTTGVATLSGDAAVNGNLTLTNGGTFFFGGNVTVVGGVFIQTNTVLNPTLTATVTVGGDWVCNGTLNPAGGLVVFNGSGAQSIGACAFYDVDINKSAGAATLAGNISSEIDLEVLNGTLDLAGYTATASGSGSFLTVSAGANLRMAGSFPSGFINSLDPASTVEYYGASPQTVAATTYGNLLLSNGGSNPKSLTGSSTVVGNLVVNGGTLTHTAGTVTLSGTNKTVAGTGTIGFNGLWIRGSVTTTNSFSLTGNLNIDGSFSATAGTVTFAGSTLFSGTANLFNLTLNGTLLQMSTAATLGVAGATTLLAGAFDATSHIPNTVVFNGTGGQVLSPIIYYNLEISGGGTKTSTGNLAALGNFTIDTGAAFDGGSGGYTNYVTGNWQNNGTFTAGNSTVELNGAANTSINGANVFNQLRLNLTNSAVVVSLATNATVGTLDMALGTLNTGTNTLTITSTRTNSGIVLGTITHQHSFATNVGYAFESPYNTITFAAETNVTSVTVAVAIGSISDFPSGAAINRQYTVSLATTNPYTATFQAHYQDAELNGNTESLLTLFQNTGGSWISVGKTANDPTNNWVSDASLTNLAGRWTLSGSSGGVVNWNGSTSTAWETPANWTVVSGTPSLPPSTNDIVQLGTGGATRQPTISSAATAKGISFASAQAMTLTLGGGGSLQTAGNISGSWSTSATHTINVGAQTLTVGGSLSLSDGTSGHTINLNLGAGTVNLAGDLTESGGANVTFSGAGNINLAGNFNYTSGTFTPGTGSITYTGGLAQAVAAVTYNGLVFNKSGGVATLTGNATVNGNLTLTNGGAFGFAGSLSVAGSVFIQTNTTLNPTLSASLNVGGDWVCNGVLNPAGGMVIFNGSGAQSIGACAFYDVDINKPSGTATLAGNISSFLDVEVINGTLDLSSHTLTASGTDSSLTVQAGGTLRTAGAFPSGFNQFLDPASTVEYYGTGSQTVVPTVYGNLLLNNGGSNPKTLAGACTVAGNLTVNGGILTNTSGTMTFSGTGKTISGTGSLGFSALSIPGSITLTNSFSLTGNLTVGGSFTATAGTANFNGATIFSGTANLFNTTLNGTLLRMSSAATLGVAGALTLTAGNLDVTNLIPNTIIFNGAGSQTVAPFTYYNLEVAGGGSKSATGNITALGNFTIDGGATFNGGSGNYTNYVAGNWLNSGTFTAGNSTVEMNGAANASLSGTTVFNQLRVNKAGSTQVVNLTTNETVGVLDMTQGTVNTGTNTLTLTSTRTNNGIVLGTITRQHSFATNINYAFEGPYNTINFAAVSNLSSVTLVVAVGNVGDFPGGGAINRQYTVSLVTTNPYSATFQAHYEDAELNGNAEALLDLDRNNGSTWLLSGRTGGDTNNNWVANSAITNLAGRWTLSSTVGGTVAWNGSVSTAWENPANWTVVAGVPALPPSVNDIVQLGTTTATNQPAISSAAVAQSLAFGSAQAMTLTLGAGGSLQTIANISGTWSSNVTHTIGVGAQSLTVGGSMALSDGTSGHKINLNVGSGTVVIGGDLNEAGGANITCSGAANLSLAGNFNYSSGAFTAGSSTVTYSGGAAQVVAPVTYNQLVFSKSTGVATLAGNCTVNGNLTLTNGGTFFFAGTVAVAGGVYIQTNTVLNPTLTATVTVGGDWVCNGTLNPAGGLVLFNGTGAQSIGPSAFYDVDINKASGTATLAGNISSYSDLEVLAGTLDLATYTVTASGSGSLLAVAAGASLRTAGVFPGGFSYSIDPASTVEYYGSGSQTVVATTYGNLVLSNGGSNPKTLAGSSTIAGNLTVNGGPLTNTTGTVTLSGTGRTISGSGAIAFNSLSIPGSISTATSFSLAGNLSVGGSFTATAGTVTFTGSTLFNGTANLFNVNLNGTLLRMSSAATLGMGGAFTLTAGSLDVTNQAPNTIIYNGAGSQTVIPVTYYNLEIAGGGTKSTTGNITALGNFKIDSGAALNGGSGGYTNYVAGNWQNNGTFTAGNGTVEMTGAGNATIAGLTVFNQLRVNKAGSSLVINLSTNVTVGTLDMTQGTVNTGTNTLTLTTTRTNSGIVLGTITRLHTFTTNVSYAFESPYNTVTFASATNISSVTVAVAVGNVGDFPGGGAINRQYTVSLTTTNPYNATFQAHYEDAELNGNSETLLALDQNANGIWLLSGKAANDTTNNWVSQSAITNLAGRWTLSGTVGGTVVWNGSISTVWETPANWTVVSGVPNVPPATNDIVQLGTVAAAYQPTLSSAAVVKTLAFGSAQAMTLTLGAGGSLQTVANVSGTWSGGATHTINVGAQTMSVGGSMSLSDGTAGHVINLNIGTGTVNMAGDLNESGGANLTCSGAANLNLSGNFNYTSGTFTPGTSTVAYRGGAAQAVAPVTYNQLVINKSTGVATLTGNATVNGNLTLTNGGTFFFAGSVAVAGGVYIQTNTVLNPTLTATISVGGDWICNGSLNPAGGLVVFNGAGAQVIGPCAFYDVDVNKASGTATLAGNISSYLDTEIVSGTVDMAGYTISATGSGSTLTVAAGAALRTPATFPSGFIDNLSAASTVEYYGSTSQAVAAVTYGNLLLNNGGSNAKTLGGNCLVAGDLLIGSAATLAAGGNNLTLMGNWTNSGSFSPGTGTVLLNGTSKSVAGNTTFSNLTISGSYTVANCDIHVTGDFAIYGSYLTGTGTHTFDGDVLNAGYLMSAGTATLTGTRVQTIQLLNAIQSVSTGIVNFNGAVPPVLNSTTPPLFANVNINNTGGVTASVGWTVFFQFNVGTGATFDGSSLEHTFYGTVTNNGVMTSSGTLNFSPASATTLELGTNFSSTGSVIFGGSHPLTINSLALALGSVEIANTAAAGITPVSNWSLTDNLQVDGGAIFHAGNGLTHQMAGDWNNNGTIDGGTSLVVFNGDTLIGGSGVTVIYNALVSSNLAIGADISVRLNFTNNGAYDGTPGGNLYFIGGANSIIAGNTPATAIDSIIVAKDASTNTVTLALSATNMTVLTVSQGILDTATNSVSEDPVNNGDLTVNANSTLRLGGTNSFPSFTSSETLNSGSTVEYSGTAQTVAALTNYANLKLSGSGNKTLSTTNTISGNVDISGTAKLALTFGSGTVTAGSLSYAGILQAQNTTYGSTTSVAANKNNTYFAGSGILTVGTILMDHFGVSVSGTPVAKSPFTIAITAQDANNNTVTSFTNLVTMTETGDGAGGTVSPTNSAYFSAGTLAGQSVTLSQAGAAVTISVTGTNSGTVYTGVSAPFTVNPATPNLSWATPTNLVYGTALGTNQNNAASTLPGTYVYNPTNGAVLPAGTNNLSVSFTPTDVNYSNRTMTVQLVVSPAVLGITADNTNRLYGATNPVFTYTATGFVNGDTRSVLTGAPRLTNSATSNTGVGTYVITNLSGTLAASNYTFLFTNGVLTLNPLPVGLSGTRAYDGTTNAAYSVLSITNIVGADSVVLASGAAGFSNPNVGVRAVTSGGTLALGGARATNYTATGAIGSITITNAPLTITANNDSKVYGTTKAYGAGSSAFTSGGLQNGETVGSVTITANGGLGATAPPGSYTLTPSAATAGTFTPGNYLISYVPGALTVLQAPAGLSLTSSLNPSGFRAAVGFSVGLSATNATGTVVFATNGTAFSTNVIVSAAANSLVITNLPRGTNVISAVYSGDADYLPATNILSQTVTNHAPTAATMTVTRVAGLRLLIAWSDIATNWTDVDGDSLTANGITLTTTNGTHLATNSAFVLYTNSPNVTDRITYGITDGFGGTNTGFISIVMQASVTGTNSIVSVQTGNPTQIVAYGIPGYSYIAERSTNLVSWVAISTNSATANGILSIQDHFTDLGSVQPTSAYYRFKWQP